MSRPPAIPCSQPALSHSLLSTCTSARGSHRALHFTRKIPPTQEVTHHDRPSILTRVENGSWACNGGVAASHDVTSHRIVACDSVKYAAAFCRVGWRDTLWPVRTGARAWFHCGIRPQAAAASCTHLSCSGGRERVAWVQLLVDKNRHVFDVFKNKRAPLLPPSRAFTETAAAAAATGSRIP